MKIDKVKLPEVNKNTILTRKEAEVMIILWNLPDKGGFTNDIIAQYEEGQKPAYTTVATFLKILASKGFVKISRVGAMLYYTPRVNKMDYCARILQKATTSFFDNSTVEFIKFLIKENKLSTEEKEEIMNALR